MIIKHKPYYQVRGTCNIGTSIYRYRKSRNMI